MTRTATLAVGRETGPGNEGETGPGNGESTSDGTGGSIR